MPLGGSSDLPRFDVVVPSMGRDGLPELLDRLAGAGARRVIVVDDRRGGASLRVPAGIEVLRTKGGGRGPAAARNAGWRAASAPRVVFVDDDVRPGRDWGDRLRDDLAPLQPWVAASQGGVHVPLPAGRRPTDW